MKDLWQYSMELAFLIQLLQSNQISAQEFQVIKNALMKAYGICSELTAVA